MVGAYEIYIQSLLTSNGIISGYNNLITKNQSMSCLLKNWYSINQAILLFETINYDIYIN